MINWDEIIRNLETQEGVSVTADPSRWNLDTPGYNEIYKMWQTANFNLSAIKWTNYYPGRHFSQDISDQMSRQLKITHIRSWISRIDPGFFAPWHWDVDDNELEYLKNGPINRFSCFIDKPAHGHIFIVGDTYFINQLQGTIYKWDNYKEWHSGINAGLTPKYMFHILGH